MKFGWHDPDAGPDRVSPRAGARWLLAAVTVAGVHAVAVLAGLNWRPAEAAGDPPAALMMELAPLAVAPESTEQVAPGPQLTEAQPDAEPEPEPPVEDKPPEINPPAMPQKEAAAVVPPPPKPEKKPPPKKKREAERSKPVNPERPKATQTSAPPAAQAQSADRMAAPAAGASTASSASAASWRGALMAHLNRHKRFPPGAGAGMAQVAFTIDRSGEVRAVRLIGSSGDAALDAEAVGLVRRASPVPPPPANIGGSSISLSVPVRFNR